MHEVAELHWHELLLRLAGRLPDEQLWRFRDWLASGTHGVLARAVPRSLLHHRLTISESEYALLTDSLLASGADQAVLNSVLVTDEPAERDYTFTLERPAGEAESDAAAVVLAVVLRGRPDVGEVRCCWRQDPHSGAPTKRVVLITASAGFAGLTADVQRVLRALGEHEPCVEVLPPDVETPHYHEAALRSAELLCVGAEGGVAA